MSARLMEGLFSEGLETFRLLVMDGEFTVELGAAIRAPGGVRRAVTALRNEFFPAPQSTIRSFGNLEVDYNQPLARLVEAGGYHYANPDITAEHFPHQGGGKVVREAVLVGFGWRVKTSEVEAELRRLGIDSADMAGLCAFGAKHPEVQGNNPVVAIGQHWVSSDIVYYGVLGGDGSSRVLFLSHSDKAGEWRESCLFLGFRDLSAPLAG